MPSPKPLTDADLIRWAVQEIRELDELCRGQIPGYDPLRSEDMALIKRLSKLANEWEQAEASLPSK